MAETKRSALVVCPGRGTYGKAELGYLKRFHAGKTDMIGAVDRLRSERGRPTVSELDGADRFSVATYSRGDIASPLIFTSSYADFLDIDRSNYHIAAVTGNSMGWYTALACAGAVSLEQGFAIVDAMGEISQKGEAGGQILLSIVDEQWHEVPGLRERLLATAAALDGKPEYSVSLSIDLAGMLVFAGNDAGLKALLAEIPPMPGREPLRLVNHGPFHSRLMQAASDHALARFRADEFSTPELPMVDGRGHIWRPFASGSDALLDYTFVTQILEPYHFARAMQVAMREFAPDTIILLGPGDTLGGAIAQALIAIQWRGLRSKQDFQEMQASSPFLLSMGRDDQRSEITG